MTRMMHTGAKPGAYRSLQDQAMTGQATGQLTGGWSWLAVAVLCLALCMTGCNQGDGQRQTGVGYAASEGVCRLHGTAQEMGRQHGTLCRTQIQMMIDEYVGEDLQGGQLTPELQKRILRMKPSLPLWYVTELEACAEAAGIEADVLLYAQCEGDIKGLGGCTTYVAFGDATADGAMEIGRNFDYWGLTSTDACAVVLAVRPETPGHYAFVSVGWTGILGGWTFFNEKGLFVANNLGGGFETDPCGVPTLILERMIAETAATIDEAVTLLRSTPRMRGQALVVGQMGDPASNVSPDAAVIHYDAGKVTVMPAVNGLAFDSSIGTSEMSIRQHLSQARRRPTTTIKSAGNSITLHSVAIRPEEWTIWVAHGRPTHAHTGGYTAYDIRDLLQQPRKQ